MPRPLTVTALRVLARRIERDLNCLLAEVTGGPNSRPACAELVPIQPFRTLSYAQNICWRLAETFPLVDRIAGAKDYPRPSHPR